MPSLVNRVLTLVLEWLDGAAGTASEAALRALVARSRAAPPSAPPAALRAEFDVTEEALPLPGGVAAACRVFIIAPRRAAGAGAPGPAGAILYLHGGAYVLPASAYHWRFAASLARDTRLPVVAPLYPLAPEATAGEGALPAARAALARAAAAAGGAARAVAVVGGSAGGGLALALCQALVAGGAPRAALPAGALLVAPWLDATCLEGDEERALARRDPMNAAPGLAAAARWYAGAAPGGAACAAASPGLAPLAGLPPISLWIGTRDILLPQCRRFAARAAAEGAPLARYAEGEGQVHHWPAIDVWGHPEARAAARDIAAAAAEDVRAGVAEAAREAAAAAAVGARAGGAA